MYDLEFLEAARLDVLEAEMYLNEYSPPAAEKFMSAIEKQEAHLTETPFMYPVYDARPFFRIMPLPYEYLCFYNVNNDTKTVTVHRILRGMRDITKIL